MDLQEFAKQFGEEAAVTYRYKDAEFNLMFSRYANGNWKVNLVDPSVPAGKDISEDVELQNELSVPVKALLADEFIALSSNNQDVMRFLLNANMIVKHAFYMEKGGESANGRPVTKDAYQFSPDFIDYVRLELGIELNKKRQANTLAGFVLNRPTGGYSRFNFDRDKQLRDNPDLGKNSPDTSKAPGVKLPSFPAELKAQADELVEGLEYEVDGEMVGVNLSVKRYATNANWYVDIRTSEGNVQIVVLSNHGSAKQNQHIVDLNLVTEEAIGDQVTLAWLQASELFESIDTETKTGKLSQVGLIALKQQLTGATK
ncbi:hypothetical protein EQG49_01700 [Periweissella cryptocerci]|uniref:Uncharacterized protein n=1 Tax=Periweissella cryptocerci TaxID=2506420 RepID=A0A4P6YRK2_9LACO|nr:hypothetical protein [Periweissella cryptocerci]QBO35264.1 hypothetical protein EQG49_01700 [Periweissella cryptocerci]